MIKKQTYILSIILFSSFIGKSAILMANAPYYFFKQIGIREGLSQSKVKCIEIDYKGFLWAGTESGLNRYDGNNLKQYFYSKENENSLLDNDIVFLLEDSLNNLWVGTGRGICLYNRINDNFTSIRINDNPIYITTALQIEDGVLFSGPGAFYKYKYDTEEFINIRYTTEYTSFWEMIRYDEETVLLNSRWRGIYSLDLVNFEIKKIESFTGINYTAIHLDSKNRLWIGLYGEGVCCYENGVQVKYFNTSNSPLTYNVIHHFAEKDNNLWLATDGGGINLISLEDFSFSHIQSNHRDVHDIPLTTVYRLHLDSSSNMWAGTVRNGLVGIKNVFARSFSSVPFGYDYGLSNNTVNSIFEDKNNVIWVGTDGGGINKYNPDKKTFRHYSETRQDKVVSIEEYSNDELIFSSFNKGVYLLNKQTGKIRPFIIIDEETNNKVCRNGYSVFLKKISENEYLLSAEQIMLYNKTSNEFKVVATIGEDFERNSPSFVATKGDITYLADLKNICAYNHSEKSFHTLYHGAEIINSVNVDQAGIFWIASQLGLRRYNPLSGISSLIENTVFDESTSVISDKKGRIWIGTRRNLYLYTTQYKSFIALDEVDGVQPNEYIPNATLLSADGDILFGGTNGLIVIDSDIEFSIEKDYRIEIQAALLNGSPTQIQDNIKTTRQKKYNKRLLKKTNGTSSYNLLKVPWYFTSIELSVSLKEDDILRNNLYRFKLNGKTIDTSRTSNGNIILSHLPIGDYYLSASYYTQTGSWSQDQPLLEVTVLPPWWKTDFFNMTLILVILLISLLIIRFVNIRSKTKQLQEIAILKNKMSEEKVNLLTNISHELRTPLTLIYAPLKRIIENKSEDSKLGEQLIQIYSHSQHMMNILNMVLDVRKLEGGERCLKNKAS